MSKTEAENLTRHEIDQVKLTECLVIIGHGIEKVVSTRIDASRVERWQPTRLIQKMDEKGFIHLLHRN